ncbi:MAG: TetR family transcriptional regulator [Nocardioidaceae bacterium]
MGRAERTRERLQETAVRLFAERGFDGVTVAEIAEAAGVSHMTFFRHFPTKESVVLDDPYDPAIGRAVAATDPALPAVARVVEGFGRAWAAVEGEDERLARLRMRIASESPSIWARVWQNTLRTERVVADALVETGVDPFEARVAAGAVLGGLMSALMDWGASDVEEPLGDRVARALSVLEPAPASRPRT